jgi:hypothetical protein
MFCHGDAAMARKKTEKKDMPATTSETKFVRLELPIETHIKLRVIAAKRGMSMAEYTRALVEEHVRSVESGKRGDR